MISLTPPLTSTSAQTYVQHLLKENADKIVNQLIEERGHFYVCGDISMAADVCRTLQGIFEETAAMSSDQARKLIESMKDNGFYHEDIFGVTLKHQEVTTRVRTAAKKLVLIAIRLTYSNINSDTAACNCCGSFNITAVNIL